MERAPFDDLLLRQAQACGAEVREGWTVGKFTHEGDSITVQARDEQGNAETLRGVFLIDASGRGKLTGNQEKLRIVHPDLKKLAALSGRRDARPLRQAGRPTLLHFRLLILLQLLFFLGEPFLAVFHERIDRPFGDGVSPFFERLVGLQFFSESL